MNDSTRIALATQGARRLGWLGRILAEAGPDGHTVLDRLRAAQGPLRGRNHEAPASSGRADATPAGAFRVDPAARDEANLDAALAAIDAALSEAWSIVGNYPPPRVATAEDRRALGLGDGPWCASCARTAGGDGRPRREPIRADLVGPTDVGGRLAQPLTLCGWCYGCVRDWGRLPSPDEVNQHHEHGRVPWPSDVPKPA